MFEPGERNPLFPFDGGLAAVAVCADTGRRSHAARAASLGATTYLASMFTIPSALESDIAKLRGYAVRHAMVVAFANYGGPTGGLPAAGRSAIWSRTSDLLVELGPTGSGVAVAVEQPAGWSVRTLG